ncbi:hypothetical protein EXIGLDRAFT_228686 [Exidia glandulosa HHB12029]|uniref:Uncharacterized protein n=1 Tax=Exidia glandulosa HHB12029 TaxID=1314781 RepID=A0A165MNK0_EXIGL|nr:hypothetical protein EXIGLDRAFT_228686 [Exidia glandulosa HHB12029]
MSQPTHAAVLDNLGTRSLPVTCNGVTEDCVAVVPELIHLCITTLYFGDAPVAAHTLCRVRKSKQNPMDRGLVSEFVLIESTVLSYSYTFQILGVNRSSSDEVVGSLARNYSRKPAQHAEEAGYIPEEPRNECTGLK